MKIINPPQLLAISLASLVLLSGCGDSNSNSSTDIEDIRDHYDNDLDNSYPHSDNQVGSMPVHVDGKEFSPPPKMKGLVGISQSGLKKYSPLINRVARQYGVDLFLVHAIISQESQYRPRGSNAGAQGLMQVIPSTGRRFGCNNVFNHACNVGAGVRYLKYLSKKYAGIGNIQTIATGYNAGDHVSDSYLNGTRLSGKNPKGRKTKFGVPVASFSYSEEQKLKCRGINVNPPLDCEGETYTYTRRVAGFYLRYKRNPSLIGLQGESTQSHTSKCYRRGLC